MAGSRARPVEPPLIDLQTRVFQVWAYSVGMSRLLLRSVRDGTHDTRVDVLFQGVTAMKLPTVGRLRRGGCLRPCRRQRRVLRAQRALARPLNQARQISTKRYVTCDGDEWGARPTTPTIGTWHTVRTTGDCKARRNTSETSNSCACPTKHLGRLGITTTASSARPSSSSRRPPRQMRTQSPRGTQRPRRTRTVRSTTGYARTASATSPSPLVGALPTPHRAETPGFRT